MDKKETKTKSEPAHDHDHTHDHGHEHHDHEHTHEEHEFHLIAEMPSEIAEYLENDGDPDGVDIEEDFSATLTLSEDEIHYFILCTATLPVEDYESNLGFGLWVEVFEDDFERFVEAQGNDEAYAKFACTGTLANDWPLFDKTIEDEVEIKVLGAEYKPHIIKIDASNDELKKYVEKSSLDENAKNHLRSRLMKLIEE